MFARLLQRNARGKVSAEATPQRLGYHRGNLRRAGEGLAALLVAATTFFVLLVTLVSWSARVALNPAPDSRVSENTAPCLATIAYRWKALESVLRHTEGQHVGVCAHLGSIFFEEARKDLKQLQYCTANETNLASLTLTVRTGIAPGPMDIPFSRHDLSRGGVNPILRVFLPGCAPIRHLTLDEVGVCFCFMVFLSQV